MAATTQKSEIVIGLVGGIILVGVLVYLSQNKSGGSGYSVIGPSDAVTTAALNAQASADASQNSLAATQSNNATTAFADYITQTAGLSAALAQTQAGVQTAQIQANSQTQINAATDSAQVQIAGYQAGSATSIAAINAGSASTIAGIQGATATSVAQSNAAANVGVAQSNAAAGVSIAQAQGNAALGVSANQASGAAQTAKNANPGNSTGGIISSITGGLASLLSWL
jgi:hypothetical protein